MTQTDGIALLVAWLLYALLTGSLVLMLIRRRP